MVVRITLDKDDRVLLDVLGGVRRCVVYVDDLGEIAASMDLKSVDQIKADGKPVLGGGR